MKGMREAKVNYEMERHHDMRMDFLPAPARPATEDRLWQALVLHLATSRPSSGSPPAATDIDVAAFETLFRRYERIIFSYLWRMLGDAQSAEDLVQETFVRAWRHFDQLDPTYERHWLFRVATNLALKHLRRTRAHPQVAVDETTLVASDPARHVVELDAVLQTLLLLPPHQRGALVLHEVHGLPCDEIGPILGISRDAVKMALWRARETFRTRYLRKEHL
jgi:RNA polymerase sigma-70 factor (ECF subfamily)